MSLFHMLHGSTANAPALLAALGLTESDVPRFRDCFWDGERIVIHTRTGGGNREAYENLATYQANFPGDDNTAGPWNDDLRAVPGFLYDEDDEFDSTYANFYYTPPEAVRDAFAQMPAEATPAEKWVSLFVALDAERKATPK